MKPLLMEIGAAPMTRSTRSIWTWPTTAKVSTSPLADLLNLMTSGSIPEPLNHNQSEKEHECASYLRVGSRAG